MTPTKYAFVTLVIGLALFCDNLLSDNSATPSKFTVSPRMDLILIYELALQNDAELAAATSAYHASKEHLPQSHASVLPSISLAGNAYNNRSHETRPDTINNWSSHGWSARLRQSIIDPKSWHQIKQAKSFTYQAKAHYTMIQQDLIMRTAEAYFNILRAKDGLATATSEEHALKSQMEQAKQRFEVGLIAETDVYEAKAAYDTARVGKIQEANEVAVALEKLRMITNRLVDSVIHLDQEMPIKMIGLDKTLAPMSIDEWVQRALSENQTIVMRKHDVEVAKQQIKAHRSDHMPTLDAVASYSHSNDQQGLNERNNVSVYGLEINVPIYSGGATSSKIRESYYLLDQAQQQLDLAIRNTATNTRNLYLNAETAIERIEARCHSTLSARSALKATKSGYEVGTRNIVDTLNAQKTLFSAQRDYFNARYDFIINSLKLKQSTGVLEARDLSNLNKWMTGNRTNPDLPIKCKNN